MITLQRFICVSLLTGAASLAADFVYVVNNGNDTLQAVDLTHPEAPSIMGIPALAGFHGAEFIALHPAGAFAYVPNQEKNTLQVVSLANPAMPTLGVALPGGGSEGGGANVAV